MSDELGLEADRPRWLKTIAIAVDEVVAQSEAMDRFRRMLRDWKLEHDARKPKRPDRRNGMRYNPVEVLPTRRLTVPERYALLAAIHDNICEKVKRIDPWGINKSVRRNGFVRAKAGMSYAVLCHRAQELADGDSSRVEEALAWVRQDLSEHLAKAPVKLSARERLAKLKPATAKVERGFSHKAMTWQRATKLAEAHCARNPFPGVKALAKIIDCSPATMSKAIDRSSTLRSKLVDHEARRKSVSTVAATEVIKSAKQSRERDPAEAASESTDALFHRLLEQATPSERAKLHAMTTSERRELVATIEHDSDPMHTARKPKR